MSLIVPAAYALLPIDDASAAINYGLNKVRFPAPVPIGSRTRTRLRIDNVAELDGGVQVTIVATVEREGGDKPVCAAELLFRYYR